MTDELFKEMLQGKRPAFIFMFGGTVQLWQDDYHQGIIVATSRQAADVFAAELSYKKGAKVSVLELGTTQQETLAGLNAVAVLDRGATGVFITKDGKKIHYLEAPLA